MRPQPGIGPMDQTGSDKPQGAPACARNAETLARDLNVAVARLSEWRDRALVGAEAAMKERERDGRDEELLRLKAKLGEVTMANELLERKIAALETARPLGRRRSRR